MDPGWRSPGDLCMVALGPHLTPKIRNRQAVSSFFHSNNNDPKFILLLSDQWRSVFLRLPFPTVILPNSPSLLFIIIWWVLFMGVLKTHPPHPGRREEKSQTPTPLWKERKEGEGLALISLLISSSLYIWGFSSLLVGFRSLF